MSITDLFRFGFINLWRRKTRTFLTALSMAIGVMCIVVLISVGLGYEQSYRESVESMGSLTKIDVRPADETLRDTVALLNDKAVEAIKQVDGVEAVTPVVNQAAYIKSGNYVNMVTLYGIDLSTAASFQLVPLEGTLPGEGARLQPEIMLTDDVAPSFSIPANDWADAVDANGDPLVDPLSADMRLTFDYSNLSGKQQADTDGRALPPGKLYRLHVTGVCSSQNNTYRTSAFLDLTRMQELLAANADFLGGGTSTDKDSATAKAAKETGPTYELVWVKCKDVDDVQRISKLIQKSGLTYLLAQRHAGDCPRTVEADPGRAGRDRRSRNAGRGHLRGEHDDDVDHGAHARNRRSEGARHDARQYLGFVPHRSAARRRVRRPDGSWPELSHAKGDPVPV